MKRIMFWLISVILFVPFVVKADSVSLRCPSEYEPNVEFSCEIYGELGTGAYNVDLYVSLTNFTFVTFTADGGLQGGARYNSSAGNYKIGLYGSNLLSGSFKIGTLRLKGSEYNSGKVQITDTVFSDDTRRITAADVSKTITLKQSTNNNDSNSNNNNNNNNNNDGNTNTGTNTNTGNTNTNTGNTNTNTGNTNTNTGNTNANTGNTNANTGTGSNTGTSNNKSGTSTNKSSNASSNTNTNTGTSKSSKTDTDVDEKTTTDDDEDETVEEYKVDFSKGAYLIDLKIDGHDIDFRSDVFQYDVTIGNEKELKIKPVVSSKNVTYTILDNKDLKDGSVVTIEVVYKKKDIQNYYINIRKDSKKNTLTIVLVGIIVALVLINVIRFLVVRRDGNETGDE